MEIIDKIRGIFGRVDPRVRADKRLELQGLLITLGNTRDPLLRYALRGMIRELNQELGVR